MGTEAFRGVIALDGPSGTGKSSTARGLARRLGARYLDTGAMYRAVTVAVLRAHVDPQDATAVERIADVTQVDVSTDPDHPAVSVDGRDVAAAIREPATTAAVSPVSAVPSVRRRLVAQQQQIIRNVLTEQSIVVEGRDIAAVVWPQAQVKVYLTARADVRAARRAGETNADIGTTAADLHRRDELDSTRATDPLRRADGAVELDTSELDLRGVIDRLVGMTEGQTG